MLLFIGELKVLALHAGVRGVSQMPFVYKLRVLALTPLTSLTPYNSFTNSFISTSPY